MKSKNAYLQPMSSCSQMIPYPTAILCRQVIEISAWCLYSYPKIRAIILITTKINNQKSFIQIKQKKQTTNGLEAFLPARTKLREKETKAYQ
jgi:hypothetical protein